MNGANIHVIPNDIRDWVVKEEGTERELGHYPTQADAEAVGLALARKRKSEVDQAAAPASILFSP
jgi:hypothetical protein